jgi:hypothetical protein
MVAEYLEKALDFKRLAALENGARKNPSRFGGGAGVFRGAPFHARNGEQVRTDHGGHKLLEPKNFVAAR